MAACCSVSNTSLSVVDTTFADRMRIILNPGVTVVDMEDILSFSGMLCKKSLSVAV
jgi:hypothetical protein